MTRKLGHGEQETIAKMLEASKRPSRMVQIRNAFVQRGKRGERTPGVLAELVAAHDRGGLELFLLHRLMASSPPYDAGKEAGVWARALGLAEDDDKMHAERVSRIFSRLEKKYSLVSRDAARRGGKITSLHEDGSGEPYTSPDRHYFRLPFAYWTQDWHRQLNMPAKAVLLIGLSQEPGFVIPSGQVKAWYGISDDTWSTGLTQLRRKRLITSEIGRQRNWLKGSAYNNDVEHTLLAPFNTQELPGFKAEETE